MAVKIITDSGRKAIKKMAQVSQCARALSLMPTAEDFALRVVGDLRVIAQRVNNISIRMNEILDRYSNIPGEFLLKGFDEILKKLDNISDYAKFAIAETTSVMSSTTKSAQEIVDAVGNATSAVTSAALQIGGGIAYGVTAMSANLTLAFTGGGRRSITHDVVQDVVDGKVAINDMEEEFDKRIDDKVGNIDDAANAVKNWTTNVANYSVRDIDEFFAKGTKGIDEALEWIDGVKEGGDKLVDDSIGVLIEKVETAKKEVEEKIERVRKIFDNFTKNFDEHFGFLTGKNYAEEFFRNVSNTANEKMDGEVFDAISEVSGEMANFIKNFNVGKFGTAVGGLIIGASTATLAMDLLPNIDVDRMMRDIIGGVNTHSVDKMTELYNNKYFEDKPDLLDIPDVPWRLSKDDLEKYNSKAYEEYLNKYAKENESLRSEINGYITGPAKSIFQFPKSNKEKMKEQRYKSALKDLRKIRRNTIKAKQIEKYKSFLNIELEYLKKECSNIKVNITNEWNLMMGQYKTAISEIKKFFTTEGCGGNESIDRCCDRINDDADQIKELCTNIAQELTSAVAMVPTPYAVGTCVDMPVHKLLAFFKDIKIIITFLKNLIRLGIDIISQLTILAKIIANGFQSLADIMKLLKDLLGIDTILNLIEFLMELFRPKMADAKILLENAISPIYYNETEDYESKVEALEALLEDDKSSGNKVDVFKYTDDPNARKKYKKLEYGSVEGKRLSDEEVEDALEELEAKGEREIVAYRSPILNAEGDDFAGWIFYHADAYDNMNSAWTSNKKRRRNKLINKASKRNKMVLGRLLGGVAQLKKNLRFGYTTEDGKYIANSVNGFDAYYWYTKWTNDPTDCSPDFSVKDNEDVVAPIQTTSNGSLVELSDGSRVFVEGKHVKSGDFVNVNGVKYRVK